MRFATRLAVSASLLVAAAAAASDDPADAGVVAPAAAVNSVPSDAGGDAGIDAGVAVGLGARASPATVEVSPAQVSIAGHVVFELRAPSGAATPEARARAAEGILQRAVDDTTQPGAVTVESIDRADKSPEWAIRIDGREAVRVGPADAAQSGLSPEVYVQSIASSISRALARERRHAEQQRVLQAIATTVFLGLLAFLALGWVERATRRARALLEERMARAQGIKLRNVEIVSAETLQGASYVLVGVARAALQIGLVYAYVAFALSQFEATRGLVGPLTHLVTAPFGSLLGRAAELLPLAILVVAGVYLLRGGLRLTGFLLDRVARGEFHWRWPPRDLALALKPILLGALTVASLLLFGTLAGAGADSLATRLGVLALAAAAFGLAPAIAAAGLGAIALFGRRYKVGEWIAVGDRIGEVIEVGFFDLVLVPPEAGRLRLPHLLTLWTPVRHLPGPPRFELHLPAPLDADPAKVAQALVSAFEADRPPEVSLDRVTETAAHYLLRFPAGAAPPNALTAAAAALARAGVRLGR